MALALFNDNRRKSASVPVTILLGCDSSSSLLMVGLLGTRTYENPSPHPVGSAGPV